MKIGDVVRLKKGTEYKKNIDEIYGVFYYYGKVRSITINSDDSTHLVRVYFDTADTELTCDENDLEVVDVHNHKHKWADNLIYKYL